MPERTDPLVRAEHVLELCQGAASDLVRGAESLGLKPEPHRLGAEARHLFVFVALSALIERGEKPVVDALKEQYALSLLDTRKQVKGIVDQTMAGHEARRLKGLLDDAASKDPFAPYYGTWESLKKSPDAGPFARFTDLVLDRCFQPGERKLARERVHTLALSYADAVLDQIYSP